MFMKISQRIVLGLIFATSGAMAASPATDATSNANTQPTNLAAAQKNISQAEFEAAQNNAIQAAAQNNAAQQNFNAAQTQEIQSIVKQYLIQNPNVIIEVMQSLQKQQAQNMEAQAEQAIKSNAPALFSSKSSPTIGNPKGSITLVEFFDYQCPHCRTMSPIIDNLVKANPELRVVYKELPIFPGSTFIAEASIAAAMQNQYLAFHNALFKSTGALNEKNVMAIAEQTGLNMQQLKKDMKSDAVKKELARTLRLANEIRLVGTPTVIVATNVNNQNSLAFFYIPSLVSQDVLQGFIKQAKAKTIAENQMTRT